MKKLLIFISCILVLFQISITNAEKLDGPGYNHMNCSHPPQQSLKDGEIVCYGIWDYGNSFGGDPHMCPLHGYSDYELGCEIQTDACQSGVATAVSHYQPIRMNINSTKLSEFSSYLQSSNKVIQDQIPGLWEYRCGRYTDAEIEALNQKEDTTSQYSQDRGTYHGYINERLFITTAGILQEDALKNCKLNHSNNPKKSIRCTWNDIVIYESKASSTQQAALEDIESEATTTQQHIIEDIIDPLRMRPEETQKKASTLGGIISQYFETLQSNFQRRLNFLLGR